MRILDLYAGLGGELRREYIENRGHEYITLDFNSKFNCTITADIFNIRSSDLGHFDFIWSSPPCESFSVASIGHHWRGSYRGSYNPSSEAARSSLKLIEHTLSLIKDMNPIAWIIENPMGMLRKMKIMRSIPRRTVTYCQYGEKYMKPTDLWGIVPGWTPRIICKRGNKCHEAAPRTNHHSGIQGIKDAALRAVVPLELWGEILDVLEGKEINHNYYRQPDLFKIDRSYPIPGS